MKELVNKSGFGDAGHLHKAAGCCQRPGKGQAVTQAQPRCRKLTRRGCCGTRRGPAGWSAPPAPWPTASRSTRAWGSLPAKQGQLWGALRGLRARAAAWSPHGAVSNFSIRRNQDQQPSQTAQMSPSWKFIKQAHTSSEYECELRNSAYSPLILISSPFFKPWDFIQNTKVLTCSFLIGAPKSYNL